MLKRSEAAQTAGRLRSEGVTVVFTNGCFDVIHEGHVHILRAARSLGHRLFVGVNTDESVRRLKGEGRPINTLDSRLKVLSEFRSVDFLVPFEEDTPMELIRELQPNILVKGGDYTFETVVGARFVSDLGGKVVIVPLLRGFSSTEVIDSIRRSIGGTP